jgi:hypothetical protein
MADQVALAVVRQVVQSVVGDYEVGTARRQLEVREVGDLGRHVFQIRSVDTSLLRVGCLVKVPGSRLRQH